MTKEKKTILDELWDFVAQFPGEIQGAAATVGSTQLLERQKTRQLISADKAKMYEKKMETGGKFIDFISNLFTNATNSMDRWWEPAIWWFTAFLVIGPTFLLSLYLIKQIGWVFWILAIIILYYWWHGGKLR